MLIFVIVIIIFSGNSSLVTYVYNIRIATIEFLNVVSCFFHVKVIENKMRHFLR